MRPAGRTERCRSSGHARARRPPLACVAPARGYGVAVVGVNSAWMHFIESLRKGRPVPAPPLIGSSRTVLREQRDGRRLSS
jgi:hypothetical protein